MFLSRVCAYALAKEGPSNLTLQCKTCLHGLLAKKYPTINLRASLLHSPFALDRKTILSNNRQTEKPTMTLRATATMMGMRIASSHSKMQQQQKLRNVNKGDEGEMKRQRRRRKSKSDFSFYSCAYFPVVRTTSRG